MRSELELPRRVFDFLQLMPLKAKPRDYNPPAATRMSLGPLRLATPCRACKTSAAGHRHGGDKTNFKARI